MNFYEKLQNLAKEQKKSLNQIERELNFSKNTLYNSKKFTPQGEKLAKLAEYFNVSVDFLLGNSENLNSDEISKQDFLSNELYNKIKQLSESNKQVVLEYIEELISSQTISNKATDLSLYQVNVYEKLAAGNGYSYIEDTDNFEIVFTDKKYNYDFASWIFGDSMLPEYQSGEVALIKESEFIDDNVYAVDWDGQSYIKKVYKEKDGLRLVSLNKKYSDKFAPFEENPRIIGKVVNHFMPLEQ